MTKLIKIIIYVPTSHADVIRDTFGKHGAGQIGNYSYCSFSTKGIGRYIGNENSTPTIGKALQLESVEEERIEVVCTQDKAKQVIQAVQETHPYEEPAIELMPLLCLSDL